MPRNDSHLSSFLPPVETPYPNEHSAAMPLTDSHLSSFLPTVETPDPNEHSTAMALTDSHLSSFLPTFEAPYPILRERAVSPPTAANRQLLSDGLTPYSHRNHAVLLCTR